MTAVYATSASPGPCRVSMTTFMRLPCTTSTRSSSIIPPSLITCTIPESLASPNCGARTLAGRETSTRSKRRFRDRPPSRSGAGLPPPQATDSSRAAPFPEWPYAQPPGSASVGASSRPASYDQTAQRLSRPAQSRYIKAYRTTYAVSITMAPRLGHAGVKNTRPATELRRSPTALGARGERVL